MKYQISLSKPAEKQLDKLADPIAERILSQLNRLRDNPRPPGAVKLQDRGNLYRIRIGDYRVFYSILDRDLLVLVVKVGHRKEIYRG